MKRGQNQVVFAAMSKRNFYLREYIVKFILEQGHTPMSAFMMYSYFLLGTVERMKLLDANNELIRRSDELWVFGEVSEGVQKEIDLAKELNLPVKHFTIEPVSLKFVEVKSSLSAFAENHEPKNKNEQ